MHVRYKLDEGRDLNGLPGVTGVADHGNEAELTLADSCDTNALLRARAERARITRFDLREQSLHEIFKRVVGGDA